MTASYSAENWRMTLAFAAGMVLLVLGCKLLSAFRQRPPPGFWLALLPSASTMRRVRRAGPGDAAICLRRCGLWMLAFAAGHWLFWRMADASGNGGHWLGWLGAPMVWLMGQMMGSLVQLLTLPTGRLLPAPHHNVFGARSVTDFWSRRWNLWMSDWFREVIFPPLARRPVLAVAVVFLVSGIIHEAVLNLSLWLVTGRNLFGSMMAYFAVQAAGLLTERRWFARHTCIRRLFAWLVVLGPAPWFVNEAFLRALHLWPGP